MRDESRDPLTEFRRINLAGTQRLAQAASRAGVRRLVYLSSIKIHGEKSGDVPLSEDDVPAPAEPYAISKWEAENALRRVSQDEGMEVAILRPPLVYGPGVKANFRGLMDLAATGVPLPFASIDNRRTFIYVENLVDAIVRCASHPAAAGNTFLVGDGEDMSTAELVRRLRGAMHKPARLIALRPSVLRAGASLLGRSAAASRLLDSLQADITKIRTLLSWQPPFTAEQGLRVTCEDYLSSLAAGHRAQDRQSTGVSY
jgi:nucleoside-diphosphate-sugar epimerase